MTPPPEPFRDLDPERIRENLASVRARAGEKVELLVATKYVPNEEMGALVEAGVELVGENRLQDLEAKRERWGSVFRWDFIGALQSRKARRVAAACERIHSLGSESAMRKLTGIEDSAPRILLQVNVAGEASKAGFGPEDLAGAIRACPLPVAGLATMPPATDDPERSRPYFARLAELAAEHGLEQLSMGTSQDWPVAVDEGATVIRLGSAVLR